MNLDIRKKIVVVCIIIGAPFFFLGGPGYTTGRVYQAFWDLGHVLFFALLTWLFSLYFLAKNKEVRRSELFAQVFFLVIIIGVCVELLQMTVNGRSPDMFDLLRNQLGCLLACAFFYPRIKRQKTSRNYLFKFCVLTLLITALWPLIRNVSDELLAYFQFPILSSFETPFEQGRWVDDRQLSRERDIVRSGKGSLQVRLSTAVYSGTSLFYFPSDWRGYGKLHFSIYNPRPDIFYIHCRIHDEKHKYNDSRYVDRYHRKFRLHSGWNDIEISLQEVKEAPLGRDMAMNQIERVGLFVVRQSESQIIYIDDVYLGK